MFQHSGEGRGACNNIVSLLLETDKEIRLLWHYPLQKT
jgi:hypothetical protein